jgi:hypothetical protein
MPGHRGLERTAQGLAQVLAMVLAMGGAAQADSPGTAASLNDGVELAQASQDTPALGQGEPSVDCSACTRRHKARLKRRKLDDDCRIKGEIGDAGERIYHLPGDSRYERTDIDPDEGERWFCTEAEAQAAGWKAGRE